MNFEKRMKKRIEERMEEAVPGPKPIKRPFPTWAKIALPSGAFVLAASIALAAILPNLNLLTGTSPKQFFATPEKATSVKRVEVDLVSRSASKTLQTLDPYFANANHTDYVLSPASYLLAVSSLAAVSDGFDLGAFGLLDAGKDCRNLLESWNCRYQREDPEHPAYCQFDCGVLHQQVGPTYRFDAKKQEKIAEDYIATAVASLKDYHSQATDYFQHSVGLSIPIPDPKLTSDGVISYGAIRMKDYVPGGFLSAKKDFHLGQTIIQVPSRIFGSVYYPEYLPYYDGENYQAFSMKIDATDLLIVLPDEGVSLETISVSSAYAEFMEHKQTRASEGYVPYFHLSTLGEDLTGALANKLTGKEVFYSKLLSDGVLNDLVLSSVLQASDFEFNRYGVAGESITVVATVGASAPVEHEVIELNVDRPFYAISYRDAFPLFVNKVNDPTK